MEPRTVLLVEDNPDDVELTLRVLRRHKLVEVTVAKDGEEALKLLEAGLTPAFVLLDLRLPKLSGKEVLQRLRTDERTRALRVVVLTASEDDQDYLESFSLGVDAYINKPVDAGKFAGAVRQLGLHSLLAGRATA
jgi:CheY-like chemotaxis protein